MPVSASSPKTNEGSRALGSTTERIALEVRDFGPIGHARVDLRPLTVFVGPSNTGKSWLATLIYALHQYFHGSTAGARRRPDGTFRISFGPAVDSPNEQLIGELAKWNNQSRSDLRDWSPDQRLVLPGPVGNAVRNTANAGGELLGREMTRCFGLLEASDFVREGSGSSTAVTLRKPVSDNTPALEHRVDIEEQRSRLQIEFNREKEIPLPSGIPVSRLRELFFERADVASDDIDMWAIAMLSHLTSFLQHIAISPLDRRAHYLPSDRHGLLHAHAFLLRSLLRGASGSVSLPERTALLSGVAFDFVEGLVELYGISGKEESRYEQFASTLESTVLDGSVRLEEEAGIARLAFRPHGWKRDLALTNASSMASDIVPVVLYLRYLVDPGDLLIIEEPESSLHPAKQVLFLRALAGLAGAGVRVLITTHSEWMLEELANVVRRSHLTTGEPSGAVLRPDQVGAWLFRPGEDGAGSEVREIELDESGIYPTGFHEVAAALHNDWAEITSRIENAR